MLSRSRSWNRFALLAILACGAAYALSPTTRDRAISAQSTDSATEAGPSATPAPVGDPNAAPAPVTLADDKINVFTLAIEGGIFMIPIAAMSLLTVTMAIERFLGLRKQKILPDELVAALGQLGGSPGGFDPRKAYRICQQFPSTASTVMRAMLLKVGRPLNEVEHTVQVASDREAERLYTNVRWLNLAAGVTPLIGLLGTVQGMIMAFHMTANLPANANKSEALAAGIYTALVTTFGGLVVAIPAAIFSHFYEGRIQTMFHQIDELIFNLLPQVERYEGRVRFSRQAAEETGLDEAKVPLSPPVGVPAAAVAQK
jgi:biopolymer transport protein ExbB